jgi:hypothetical protein
MKELPIIMGAESVRAILEGRKTQTRRVAKATVNGNKPVNLCEAGRCEFAVNRLGKCVNFYHKDSGFYMGASQQTYEVGDRLWVRETAIISPKNFDDKRFCNSTDNEGDARIVQYLATSPCTDGAKFYGLKPKSPLFMPRWASRITLEITDIRVERVQDITEEDAIAEGVISDDEYAYRAGEDNLFPCPRCKGYGVHAAFGHDYGITEVDCTHCNTPKKRYRIVWDSLNAKRGYPWESNPWVWVVSFKVVN